MEEVLAPGPDGVQEIIYLYRPFNRGESSAYHLHDLYLIADARNCAGRGER